MLSIISAWSMRVGGIQGQTSLLLQVVHDVLVNVLTKRALEHGEGKYKIARTWEAEAQPQTSHLVGQMT